MPIINGIEFTDEELQQAQSLGYKTPGIEPQLQSDVITINDVEFTPEELRQAQSLGYKIPSQETGPLQGKASYTAEVLSRLGETGRDVVEGAIGPLQQIGSQIGEAYSSPQKALDSTLEIARTAVAPTPIGGSDFIQQLLGGRPGEGKDTVLAGLFGVGTGVEALAKGTASLPADIANQLEYIATGNKGSWKPALDVNFYGQPGSSERAIIDEAMAKEQLASVAGGLEPFLIPIPGMKRVGSISEKAGEFLTSKAQQSRELSKLFDSGTLKAPKNIQQFESALQNTTEKVGNKLSIFGKKTSQLANKPSVGTTIEGIEGVLYEPTTDDPQKRFGSRGGQGLLTGVAALGGYGVGAITEADKVQKVMNAFKISKNEAQKIVQSGQYEKAIKLARDTFPAVEKSKSGLLPLQTAAFKKYNVAGNKEGAVQDLMQRLGLSRKDALAKYNQAKKLQTKRTTVTDYLMRQEVDKQINTILERETAPFPGSRTKNLKILGGEKGLLTVKDMVLVQQAKELGKLLGIDAVDAKNLLRGIANPIDNLYPTPAEFSWVTRAQVRFGLLSTGNLMKVPEGRGLNAWEKIRDFSPLQTEMVDTARTLLNQIKDDMLIETGHLVRKIPILNDVSIDIAALFNKTVKDGTLYRIFKGDYSDIDPETIARLQPIAARLQKFNEELLIPKIRQLYDSPEFNKLQIRHFQNALDNGVLEKDQLKALAQEEFERYLNGSITKEEAIEKGYYREFDGTHLSNSQTGSLFVTLDLTKLKQSLGDEFENFVEKFNIGKTEISGKKMVGIGYVDSLDEVFDHFTNARQVYEKEFPFLYGKQGLNKDLFIAQNNLVKFMADLRYEAKLGMPQLVELMSRNKDMVTALEGMSGLNKTEIQRLVNDSLISGNIKNINRPWSKFIGSLQKGNNKLIMKNIDPFQSYYKQSIDLSKKMYIEPIVNELLLAKKTAEDLIAAGKYTSVNKTNPIGSLQDEVYYYQDLIDMYRGVPNKLEGMVSDAIENFTPDKYKRTFKYWNRKWGDVYVGLESLAKLGINLTASVLNITEGLYSMAAESLAHPDQVIMDFLGEYKNAKFNPVKFLDNIILDAQNNKAVFYITGKTQADIKALQTNKNIIFGKTIQGVDIAGLTDKAFTGSDRFFQSKTLGTLNNAAMYAFNKGTTVDRLISYSFWKRMGKRKNLKGMALEDWVTDRMTEHKRLTELDKMPLTTRSQGAKVMLIFTSYLTRIFDHSKNYWENALTHPTPENISKAMMFDFAPALLFGAKSSASLGIGTSVYNSIMGTGAALKGNTAEPVPITDELKVSSNVLEQIAGKGLFGAVGIDVSNLVSRDPFHMIDLVNLLPVSETESLATYASDTFNSVQTFMNGMFNGKPADMDEAFSKFVKTAGNAARTTIVPVNRIAKGIDIFQTGQVRDRAGNKIIDLEDTSTLNKSKEALAQIFGTTNSKAQQERILSQMVKFEAGDIRAEGSSLRKEIKDIARQHGYDLQFGKQSNEELIKKYQPKYKHFLTKLATVTGTEPDEEALIDDTIESMMQPAFKRAMLSLPEGTLAKLKNHPNKNIQRLFNIFIEEVQKEQNEKDTQELEQLLQQYEAGYESGVQESIDQLQEEY